MSGPVKDGERKVEDAWVGGRGPHRPPHPTNRMEVCGSARGGGGRRGGSRRWRRPRAAAAQRLERGCGHGPAAAATAAARQAWRRAAVGLMDRWGGAPPAPRGGSGRRSGRHRGAARWPPPAAGRASGRLPMGENGGCAATAWRQGDRGSGGGPAAAVPPLREGQGAGATGCPNWLGARAAAATGAGEAAGGRTAGGFGVGACGQRPNALESGGPCCLPIEALRNRLPERN